MQTTENRVKEIMSEVFNIEISKISNSSSKNNIEQWDSINNLNLILAIEEDFDVEIPLEDYSKFTNFGNIINILRGKIC